MHLVEVVEEHLPHLVDGYSSIDRTLQLQPAHQIGQETEVKYVRETQQNCINLVNVSAQVQIFELQLAQYIHVHTYRSMQHQEALSPQLYPFLNFSSLHDVICCS